MCKIKNILFDFGGVIITLNQPQAVRHFMEIGLTDAEQRLDPYRQSGIFGDLEIGKINAEQFRSELSRMIGRDVTYDDCMYAWKGYVGDLPKRNLDILRRLRAEGYRLILLSNTNPYMMGWAMSDSFDGEGHSLEYYFDAVYLSYKCGVMKPDERFSVTCLIRKISFRGRRCFLMTASAMLKRPNGSVSVLSGRTTELTGQKKYINI